MMELRYALRYLWRAPGFTAVAVVTLVLGMGANTAFFSVLYGVVLRQPSYPGAERLVTIHNALGNDAANGGRLSRAEVRDYQERQRAFEGLGAADLGRSTLTSDNGAERVKLSHVTPNVFAILGVAPVRGRGFLPGEGKDLAAPIAVLSDEFWQAHFAGDPDILHRTVRLNGIEYAIVGVMPPGFSYPESGVAAWMPLDVGPRDASDRGDHYLGAVGRLAPGLTTKEARLDLQRVARQLQRDTPAAYPSDALWSIGLESLRESQFGHMLVPLGVLMATAASVLLIACVNVATMSLLRAVARRREIKIRLALGASRRHVIRQLVTESAVVCLLGACGGLILAQAGLDALKAFAPGDIPRLSEVSINLPAALFTGIVLVLVTLIVGLAPAVVVAGTRAFDGAIATTRSSDDRMASRLREAFTVMEIALAAALLICAGLTVRSLQGLVHVDLGFATENRFSFKTNLTARDYPDQARVDRFYGELTTKLESLPGTLSIGAISYLPLSGEAQAVDATPVGASSLRDGEAIRAGWGIVRGRYFETMGLTLLQGRLFAATDRPDSPRVAIVDDVLARRLWTSEAAAIGREVRLTPGPGAASGEETRTIVGVVRRVTHFGPGKPSLPAAYAPQSQVYQRGMYTVIKTTGTPEALTSPVRAALASVDASVPMYFTGTVDARYDEALALPRFTAGLVSAFSTLALVLAGVGIFGVTAYAVGQRRREFSIRVALGAQRAHVCGLVLRRVGILAAAGVGLGAALALGLGGLMSGILFGVEPADVPTMTAAMAAVALTALVASLAPLRYALRVNPAETLRAE